MSLFTSIHVASGALQANQIALQVVGQNIANANSSGYVREQAVLTPGTTQRLGSLNLGTGVSVTAVVQIIDKALEERLRGAQSDSANTQTVGNTYQQLESVLGSLGDHSLGQQMTSFFESIADVLNSPEDVATRNLAVLQGTQLATNVNYLAQQVETMRSDSDAEVVNIADNVNRLSSEISQLNIQIAAAEGGVTGHSDAVGLRDQRQQAMSDLAHLVGIRVVEQKSGAVNIYCGSTYLVYGGTTQPVETVFETVNGRTAAEIHYVGNEARLDATSGLLAGVMESRDGVLATFSENLDIFAQTLATEFNKVYSSGQGLQGYDSLTSQSAVDSPDAALNAVGLTPTPVNGSFQILVYDTTSEETTATTINVNLSGVGQQTTLNSLSDALNQVSGIKATSKDGKLTIESTNSDCQIAFSNDTSGVLAALGLNTFFTGKSALGLGVNQAVKDNPATFAASTNGISSDTTNAATLANFADVALPSQDGKTLSYLYSSLISTVTQSSAVAQSQASAASTFQSSLTAQETAISGVNIDEEAVNMMSYQRAYQACAKYISTINDLLDTLLKL